MSEFNLTASQQAAVDARDKPILVSAAAGSGKTRVLTERLIARVREGVDIDRFLVITFTRAAAAELRGRILTALNELSAENPTDRRIRRQSALLYRAQIGTIDSFCTAVVRENAHRLGLSPGFAMLDEERSAELLARSLEEVMERAYERIGDDAGLALLIDSVGAGRDDKRLAELVRSLYGQMQSRAFPEQWSEEVLSKLDAEGMTDAAQTEWGRYLLNDATAEAQYRSDELDRALSVMAQEGNEPLMQGYGDLFAEFGEKFRDVVRRSKEGWDAVRTCFDWSIPRLTAVKKFPDEETKNRVKAVWDSAKKAWGSIASGLAGSSDSLLAGLRNSKPALSALMGLVSELDREYAERKRRADACDFSDVEHFCIRLLCGENGEATPLASSLSARFAEVMVDEYQDVNAVQELIFRRVSGEGAHLFMVGDVKQSIYRFRLAEPSIFNGKYEAFAEDENACRILLRENFRSRGCVLNACNAVFDRIMSRELGEIEYDENARLVQGASYPEAGEEKPVLYLLDAGAGEEDEDEPAPDKSLCEARFVARRIRELVDGGAAVSDGQGGLRPVTWRDIAILMRTPNTSGAPYRQAMAEWGVPLNARQGGMFFSQPEVSFALSMLAVADNPRQDVPLIAALRSLPFAFTPEELTNIRTTAKGDFWGALCKRGETDERCAQFAALVLRLRDLAREEPPEVLLRHLYDATDLLTICAVLPDGQLRTENLMQLYEYARSFTEGGNTGLFRFVSWLRELEERGIVPPMGAEANAVTLLSIHKSKGLEFPVVFLVDNAHRWNRAGTEAVLCHSDLGIGMRMTDTKRGADWPTLPWRAIKKKIQREELSEQERVLYVAMTRAREKLFMTASVKNAAEKLEKYEGAAEEPISPRMLADADCTAKWLMAAAVRDGGRTVELSVQTTESIASQPEADRTPALAPPEETLVEQLAERVAWQYPYAAAELPSKITATGVKQLQEESPDPEAASLVPSEKKRERFRRPELGGRSAPLTGAERGIAEHLVMQHIDFRKTGSIESIEEEIRRLTFRGFLSEQQAEAVPPGDILAFFRSPVGERLLAADHVTREFRFSLLCPAKTWYPDVPEGEEILLQGVVDCCIEEKGELTVIDFKTDGRVEPSLYKEQLRAYAVAMERILQKPVKGVVLWYLRRRQAVETEMLSLLSPETKFV